MTTAEVIGAAVCAFGLAVVSLNFYLGYLRYPLYLASGHPKESYKFISGLPLLGSLAVWIGAPFLRSYPWVIWPSLAVSLLDTLGPHVLLVVLAIMVIKSIRDKGGPAPPTSSAPAPIPPKP